MASIGHTYGPSCLLHAESNTFTRRASQVSIGPPPMRAQYFYCSSLPIDDPLSPIPPPPSGSAKPPKVPPRPFSIHDNRALEEAWLKLHQPVHTRNRAEQRSESAQEKESGAEDPAPKSLQHVAKVFKSAHEQRGGKKEKVGNATAASEDVPSTASHASTVTPGPRTHSRPNTSANDQPSPQNADHTALNKSGAKLQTKHDPDLTLCDDPDHIPFDDTVPVGSDEIGNDEFESGLKKRRSFSPFRRKDIAEKSPKHEDQTVPYRRLSRASQKAQDALQLGSSPSERDTTGTPFLRIPSRMKRSRSRSRSRSPDHRSEIGSRSGVDTTVDGAAESPPIPRPMCHRFQSTHSRDGSRERGEGHLFRSKRKKAQETKVLVGISRLHVVEMPSLKVRSTESMHT